jgi:hypothetical protein
MSKSMNASAKNSVSSTLRESHLLLFRNRPTLAAELVGALGVELPPYQEAHSIAADLAHVRSAGCRPDMVIRLSRDSAVVYAIVVEIQVAIDRRKRFVWPAYVANLRARLECPVVLLVVTANEDVTSWAEQTIHVGGLFDFTPCVTEASKVADALGY